MPEVPFKRPLSFLGLTTLFAFLSPLSGDSAELDATEAEERAKEQVQSLSTYDTLSHLPLDRVDVLGVRIFDPAAIEAALRIAPGDIFDRGAVLRTEQNILSLYRARGYSEARIENHLLRKKSVAQGSEVTLEFVVTEGRPIRVASVEFQLRSTDPLKEQFLKSNLEKFKAQFGAFSGSVFDKERLDEGKLALQEFLAANDYIGARVIEMEALEGSPPSLPVEKGEATEWVKLKIVLELGEKVQFGFRGNTEFTSGYLQSIVDEKRILGVGRDYVRDIQALIVDLYHSIGFDAVEVIPFTFESPDFQERHVTYEIHEGPRIKIDSVDFDGNITFDSNELRQQFFAHASNFIQKQIYVEKDVQKAADALVQWMREKGYLSAKMTTTHSVYISQPRSEASQKAVKVIVYLVEGDQTIVQHIQITGAHVLTPDQIKATLGVQESGPLNLSAFGDGLDLLKKRYRDLGYLNFTIANEGSDSVIQYSQENRSADLFLKLEEGPQFKIGKIKVEGLVKAKETIILRELNFLDFKEGVILGESKMIQAELQLKRLGIFSALTVRTQEDSNSPDVKQIVIKVTEAERGILTWGPGVRSDLGVRLFSQLAYTDIWGENHTGSINVFANRRFYQYNFIEAQAQVAYTWPWFLIPGMTFRPSLQYGKTQYYNFAANNLMLSTVLERQLASKPNLLGSLGYTLERILQFNAAAIQDNSQLRIGTVTPRLTLDLRDNPLAPTKGIFVTGWLDVATSGLGSSAEIGFYRAQFRTDFHLPVWRNIGLFFSFRTGYEQAYEDYDPTRDSIPLIKQFALGGIGSLRGYHELEYSKPQSILIKRSLSYVNYRTQVDLPIAGAFKFGVFVDAANLNVDSYCLGGLVYGTGFGFHYLTPLGSVNFDLGFKLTPPPGSDTYVTHFSLGVI